MTSSTSALHLAGSVALRTAALAGGWLAFDPVYSRIAYDVLDYRPIGADIGEGLLAFGLVMGVSALWAGWDGGRRSVAQVAALWSLTAVLAGAVFALPNPFGSQAMDLTLTDFVTQLPFMVGLVAVPALVVGILVAALRHGRHGRQQHA